MLVAGFEPTKSYDTIPLIDNVKLVTQTLEQIIINSASHSFDRLDILADFPNYGIGYKLYFRV